MDEKRYQELADAALGAIESMLEHVDADDVDVERAGDVVTLAFRNGKKAVVNGQRPTRQMWLAADAKAWHFSFDEARRAWLDDKGRGVELLGQIAAIVREQTGIEVKP